MEKIILDDYEQLSRATTKCIVDYVNQKPNALLCIAGGHTPLRTFELLVEASEKGQVNFGNCKFVGLDEWVGLGRDVKGGCQETLYNHLFNPLDIKEKQICFFDGLSSSMAKECKRVDDFIYQNGPIDLMLLGVGMNGHLGFNEPGVSIDLYSHIVKLDAITTGVSSKYFDNPVAVQEGITLGIKHIMASENVLLMANGAKKSDIVKDSLLGEVTTDIPASILQKHSVLHVFLDKDAASKLVY